MSGYMEEVVKYNVIISRNFVCLCCMSQVLRKSVVKYDH